jgi:hypothetical protein
MWWLRRFFFVGLNGLEASLDGRNVHPDEKQQQKQQQRA